jgi:Transposase.
MNQQGLSGRRQYSAEFKARVVALCQSADASVAEIARAHEVDVNLLRRWIRRQVGAAPRLPPPLVPILQTMHAWLVEIRPRVANNGALAKAIDYTLKRWPALSRYAHTGHLPIDNNPVENAIRPIALGKKN